MRGVTEMPPIRPACGRTRRGGALAVIALAAIGCLALVAPSAEAQTELTRQNRFGNAPAVSTICHFNRGPRSGTNLDYGRMGFRPLPVGSFCQDGAGSTGDRRRIREARCPSRNRLRQPSDLPLRAGI